MSSSNVVQFPIEIDYQVCGIHRDGRVIVQIINSPKKFMMYAENIVADHYLLKNFPKNHVKWLCDLAANDVDRGKKQTA